MRPASILETVLYGRELEELETFYAVVIGLELHSKQEGRHVFFRCGEGMLLLFDPELTSNATGLVPPHGARGPGHVAFAIDESELAQWKEHLASQQIAIEAEVTWPGGGRSIYFRDPAGNSVELATPRIWQRD
jgi:catechol-2,3-dioxygenase